MPTAGSIGGLLAAAVVLCLALSGCGEPGPDEPVPEEGYRVTAPLADTTNIVFFLPVQGIKEPANLILADALAASLRDAARPAVLSETVNDQGPTVVGKVVEVRKRGSVAWVTAVWQLRAPYGTTVAETRHEVVVDKLLWEEGGVEAVNLLVAEAEPHIIGMVSDHVGPLSVTDEIAMPPEERMSAPSGTGVSIERPVAADAPIPAEAMPEAADAPAMPTETMAEAAAAEDMMPPELTETGEMGLTEADMVAAPPSPAGAPVRLLPRKAGDPMAPAVVQPPPGMQEGEGGMAMGETKAILDDEMSAVPDNTRVPPVVWGKPSFIIRPVQGAPGDGNEALTIAIKAAMRERDLTVTEDPRQAGYEIVGSVTVGPPVNGRQQARIVWTVVTGEGDEVGRAVQENAVISGSLDDEWGRVADIVSVAAVNGIEELFGADGRPVRPVSAAPSFGPAPALDQVPGRAPPPPAN